MALTKEITKGKKYRLFAEVGKKSDGSRRRKTKIVKSTGLKEARKVAQKFEDELVNGLAYSSNMLFSTFSEKWKENYVLSDLSNTTIENYTGSLKHVVRFFGDYKMGEINAFLITDFFKMKEKKAEDH